MPEEITKDQLTDKLERGREKFEARLDKIKKLVWGLAVEGYGIKEERFNDRWRIFMDDLDSDFIEAFSMDLDVEDM